MQAVGRMTALAYAIFIFNGLFNVLPGVLLMNIAGSFQVDTHSIGYIYSLLILGNVIAVQANGCLLEKVDIKKELICGIGAILIAVLGITSGTYLPQFALSIFLNGIGSGILTSISSYLIVNLYDAKERSSKLNLLHFTFSVGAIVSPLIAGNLITIGISWQYIYRYPMVFLAFLFILALTTKIQIKKRTLVQEKKGTDKWGIMIYVIAIALFCYMLAEQSFLFWGNTYFVENLSFDMARASSLISLFWVFMAIGRFSSGVILQYISVEKFIIGFSFLGFAAFVFMLNNSAFWAVFISVALMGLGFSGLYASILSYGTLQLKYPSAELMSMYMSVGYLGGVMATPFSSLLKSVLGLKLSLMISTGFMAMIFMIILIRSSLLRREQK